MSTTATSHCPIRVPNRPLCHDRRPDAGPRIQDLAAYRLARLEAEILAPARGTASVDLRLRRFISAYVKLAITDPGIMPLLSDPPGEATSPPAVRDTVDSFISALREDLAEVIQAQERTPAIDPGVAVQSLLGIIHWGVSSHRAEGRLSRDEAAAQITFLALHGLVAPRPEPSVRPLAQPLLCGFRLEEPDKTRDSSLTGLPDYPS